eukprot:364357-Chlamydomonas_euryale.AAC.3
MEAIHVNVATAHPHAAITACNLTNTCTAQPNPRSMQPCSCATSPRAAAAPAAAAVLPTCRACSADSCGTDAFMVGPRVHRKALQGSWHVNAVGPTMWSALRQSALQGSWPVEAALRESTRVLGKNGEAR